MNSDVMTMTELKASDKVALESLKQRLQAQDLGMALVMGNENSKKLTSDFYLFQWLRANGMNVQKTAIALRNSFTWRTENGILDKNLDDFPQNFRQKFPIYEDSISRTGLRVYTMTVSEWDVKAAVDGEADKLARYIYLRILQGENEWLEHNERALKKQGTGVMYYGETIKLIVNAKDTPLTQFVDRRVIAEFINIMKCLAVAFPRIGLDIFFVNFSTLYYIGFSVVRPFLDFAAQIHIYNCNAEKWEKVVAKFMDVNQLDF